MPLDNRNQRAKEPCSCCDPTMGRHREEDANERDDDPASPPVPVGSGRRAGDRRRVRRAAHIAPARGRSYLGAALLAAMGTALNAHGVLCVGAIWAAHVGFDRLLGYGLKYGTSF